MISKEEKKKYDKEYRAKNRERIKLLKREQYLKNKEKILDQRKHYFLKNSEKLREYQKIYRIKNIEKIRNRKRLYQAKKRKTDINYRVSKNLRARITTVLRNKNNKFNDLIGCTKQELIIYLESKFLDGMTWDNYGIHGWHIDHIVPVSKFNLENEEDQKRCFHYSNLQPLWAKDNLSKGGKII